jgi:hypothetical protein
MTAWGVAALGPYLAACALLVGAGVAKAVRPGDTARAIAGLVGIPVPAMRAVVRVGAGAESVLGLLGLLALTAPVAACVAASYAGFAAFVAVARRHGGVLATCGCFGNPDTPPTRLHVLLDVALALSGVLVAAGGAGRGAGATWHVLGAQPLAGVPLVAGALLAGGLVYLVMVGLARLSSLRLGSPGGARR